MNICLINTCIASCREVQAMQDTLIRSQRQILVGEISGFVNTVSIQIFTTVGL
jgi:hypothetical protein